MYASESSSNYFSEIGPFSELKYASSSKENEPPRKKRCGLQAIASLPNEHTHTSAAIEQLEACSTSLLLATQAVGNVESHFSTTTSLKLPNANGSKQRKESAPGSLDADVPPPEEVLGSVTTFYPAGHPENGHTLRTSARVKYKMRMETIQNTPPPAERKELPKPSNASLAKTPNQQKQMRVVWSNHDKNLFFEALNEYGKDFEAILTYLNTKKRRKDNACEQQVFKTKDVRNLYYQFNQKISKYLHFSDEVKKEAQELYSLINYGEMRKKVPFQNKKYFHKLKDLVYKGFTMVREKGKSIRIKTPSCRALRKLNQLEEWQEEIKLPPRVDVLLQPANMEAWGQVQSLAQNPRVRITVTIQKRVSALLQLFQQKWRPQELRLVERVEKMKAVSAGVTSKLLRQRMQNEILFCSQLVPSGLPPALPIAPAETGAHMLLHFVPSQTAVIHRPLISLAEFQSNTSICLNSYEQRIGVKVRGETLASTEKPGSATCRDSKKSKLCPDSGHDAAKDEKLVTEQLSKSTMNELLKSPNASNESIELKDMEAFEMELLNGGARYEFVDSVEALVPESADATGTSTSATAADHAYATFATDALVAAAVGSDTAATRLSDSSCDEFGLPGDGIATKYESDTLADHSGGEEAAIKLNSTLTVTNTITACVTTVTSSTTTTTTVRKREKCPRRKGPDGPKASAAAGVFNHLRPLVSEQEMQRIRDGWTLSNASDMTIGDLYIMFGEDMKLHLEYDWVWEETAPVRAALPLDVKEHPAAGDEQQPLAAIASPKVEGEQQWHGGGAVDTPSATSDGVACLGNGNCARVKEEPAVAGTIGKEGGSTISRRLKHLLMLINMGGKNSKKKCTCGNAFERKPKRNDCDNSTSSTQDDSALFKQPPLPARNGVNYLVPELMHMPPQVRYKQSRWWRTRFNRQLANYPSHPLFRSIHTATDTSADPGAPTTSQPLPAGSASGSAAATDEPKTVARRTLHYEEENANDSSVSQSHPIMSSNARSVVVNSEAAHLPVGEIAHPDCVPLSVLPTTTTTTTTEVHDGGGTLASTHVLPPNDNSCLSLFDLSLPSTSSSLMANIFSTAANGADPESSLLLQGGVSALLPSSPNESKLLDASLNDISLTSFFGQLDAVYRNEEELHHRPVPPPEGSDLDLSAMNEGSVDYIACFENIASELRAHGNN